MLSFDICIWSLGLFWAIIDWLFGLGLCRPGNPVHIPFGFSGFNMPPIEGYKLPVETQGLLQLPLNQY